MEKPHAKTTFLLALTAEGHSTSSLSHLLGHSQVVFSSRAVHHQMETQVREQDDLQLPRGET
jgi:hypothetical protein